MDDLVDIYVQIHPDKIADIKSGLYIYKNGELEKMTSEIISRKDVIAINQEVYNQSFFGITTISKTDKDWMAYINLGRILQTMQMNDVNLGFMSSGYSSKTGWDLPSAKKIKHLLGKDLGPSYFFVGGRVSDAQIESLGMDEDAVHMKGPSEIIHDDLVNFLPVHMIPNKVIVLDKMPLTANGKIDFKELNNQNVELIQQEFIEPRNEIEQELCNIWKKELKRDSVSVNDSFFEMGGNSLIAVSMVHKINKQLNSSLSLQVLFESPTIEKLAVKVICDNAEASSRLILLQKKGYKKPIYCWPGLGGYCMNLRLLAEKMGKEQPFYGIQACGINKKEVAYSSIEEMAAEDIKMIKKVQSEGPYSLWGYSFGSRVAFEVAYQLEQAGDTLESLFLIAPGAPKTREDSIANDNIFQQSFSNKVFVTILFSVFMGNITNSALEECLRVTHDEDSFIRFITNINTKLDPDIVKRIVHIVIKTYGLGYSIENLKEKRLKTSISIFKAEGDRCSVFEDHADLLTPFYSIVPLTVDHYSLLKDHDANNELIKMIQIQRERCADFRKAS
jgi:thioesterase domain-containing protein